MLFAVHCLDRENSVPLRQATRPAHLDYMKQVERSLILAGPYLNADGDSIGSLLIYDVDTIEDCRRLIDADPYSKAGLFGEVRIYPWRWVINAPAG